MYDGLEDTEGQRLLKTAFSNDKRLLFFVAGLEGSWHLALHSVLIATLCLPSAGRITATNLTQVGPHASSSGLK